MNDDQMFTKVLLEERRRELEQRRLIREAERAHQAPPRGRVLRFPGRRPRTRAAEPRRPTRRAA